MGTGRHITFERPTALSAGAAAVRGPLNPGSAYGGPRTTGDGYYESYIRGIEGNLIEITE